MTDQTPSSRLKASCAISFEVEVPTPMVFVLRPRSDNLQWVCKESYHLSPQVPVHEYTDGFGNLVQRVVAQPGPFEIRTSVEVELASVGAQGYRTYPDYVDMEVLPPYLFTYLLPSRYCESDRFGEMATDIVAGCRPGLEQVEAITRWVRDNVRFTPLSSPFPVSAIETNGRREGVCRDLAQIAIALCRALCIPARLVSGYLSGLEPMDIHAWFEAYIGDDWYTFDPTQPDLSGKRISIARGRDATDVAIYTQFGPLLLPLDMEVTVSDA